MNHKELTSSALTSHLKKYPLLKPRDIFKFLYHSVFGCEHMISSPESVVDYIKEHSVVTESDTEIGIR